MDATSKQESDGKAPNKSTDIEAIAFRENLFFELFYSQKEAARFLELAYLALKEDTKIARKVRKTADDAQNQHMMTHGLMIKYQDTARYVVKSMLPLLEKALDKKNVKMIKKILEKLLEYVKTMIKNTNETKDRYYAIKGEVQCQISDINEQNAEITRRKNEMEVEKQNLKDTLQNEKQNYDALQKKQGDIAKDIKENKQKHREFLEKSIKTEDDKTRETLESILIPEVAVAATLAGGPVLGGVFLIAGLASSQYKSYKTHKHAVDASNKMKEEIKESEKKSDETEERMLRIKEESIKKITMMRKLSLESVNHMNQESLVKASEELGQVGQYFAKILFFWENFAAKLDHLIEEKDTLEMLLGDIDDSDYKQERDESVDKIKEVWSAFRIVCAYYVTESEREIDDLYAFLYEPVDQLSLEECRRRQEEVLAKMEDEVKALTL